MKDKIIDIFKEKFGDPAGVSAFFAPGRVNLIGEHTDYNGGHVFPCALSMGTYAAVRLRDDGVIRLYSANFPDAGVIETSLDELIGAASGSGADAGATGEPAGNPAPRDLGWAAYPAGVVRSFADHGHAADRGFDIAFIGDIPTGSGLSSSASIEVLTGTVLKDFFGFDDVSMVDVALYSQYSENHYNGVNCGIMDQFASAMGKRDCAIFLDTNTLEYEYAPLPLEDEVILIVNSMVKHNLAESGYNDRRRECEGALKALNASDLCKPASGADTQTDAAPEEKVDALCKLTPPEFEKLKDRIKDPVQLRRARHAVTEDARTVDAKAALERGDLAEFGRLMNASHESLRDDYEVSCEEADLLVELALEVPGVLGSRMTGGGFGGCTVSLLKKGAEEEFRSHIAGEYEKKTGIVPEIYSAYCGPGAGRI
ncbi:MAG: galactokinase [Eubacterium sp.]|nr:galactokinase [Eubacterium sp.]